MVQSWYISYSIHEGAERNYGDGGVGMAGVRVTTFKTVLHAWLMVRKKPVKAWLDTYDLAVE